MLVAGLLHLDPCISNIAKPTMPILSQTMFEQLTDRRWRAGGERLPIRLSTENAHQRVGDCLSIRKRLTAREHFIQDAAERPHIAPLVRGPASRLLGTHVRGGAQDYSHPRHRRADDCRSRRPVSAC